MKKVTMRKITYLFFAADDRKPEIVEHHPELKQSPLIVGILPAELCSSFIRDCPPSQKKYLSKTLPYLVEDSIASPIDTMHCLSQAIANSQIRVLAVSRDRILQCNDQAESLGLKLDQLYIDADLMEMPSNDKLANAITSDGRQLIKTSDGLIAAFEEQATAAHIQELSTEQGTDSRRASASGSSRAQCAQRERCKIESYPLFCIDRIQKITTNARSPLNLLQGDFTPRQSAAARTARVQKILMFSLAIFFVQIAYFIIAGAIYQDKSVILRKQSEASYSAIFPNDNKIIDLVAQAEGHLSQLTKNTQGHSFLTLLAELGVTIKTSEVGASILLKSVHYEKTTGQLRAELVAKQISPLEKVQKQLIANTDLMVKTDQISESPSTTEEFPASIKLTLNVRKTGAAK